MKKKSFESLNKVNARKLDGRVKFDSDKEIELLLSDHFKHYKVDCLEVCRNFPIYSRRPVLKRFIAHYELFRMVKNLPGDIVELGVYRGTTLMEWANFVEILNMGDRQKQIFGFDNFKGFTEFDKKDGKIDQDMNKIPGGFNPDTFEEMLEDAISIYDKDRFIPYKARVVLVKGNIEETVPRFVENNPGLRLNLIHFDCDMYRPTIVALKHFWPLIVHGGVAIFDDYGLRPWEGESKAVEEYFEGKAKMHRFDWTPTPGGYIIKGE